MSPVSCHGYALHNSITLLELITFIDKLCGGRVFTTAIDKDLNLKSNLCQETLSRHTYINRHIRQTVVTHTHAHNLKESIQTETCSHRI